MNVLEEWQATQAEIKRLTSQPHTCCCPAGSYDAPNAPNAVHEPYCALAND